MASQPSEYFAPPELEFYWPLSCYKHSVPPGPTEELY
jgi:hypothetical protein